MAKKLVALRLSGSQKLVQPISVLRFWISEGLTQAESLFQGWNSHVRRGFPGNLSFCEKAVPYTAPRGAPGKIVKGY